MTFAVQGSHFQIHCRGGGPPISTRSLRKAPHYSLSLSLLSTRLWGHQPVTQMGKNNTEDMWGIKIFVFVCFEFVCCYFQLWTTTHLPLLLASPDLVTIFPLRKGFSAWLPSMQVF